MPRSETILAVCGAVGRDPGSGGIASVCGARPARTIGRFAATRRSVRAA
jgi:hypothetical protein